MEYKVEVVDKVTIVKGSVDASVLLAIITNVHNGREGYVADALIADHFEGMAFGHKDDCKALRNKLGLSL